MESLRIYTPKNLLMAGTKKKLVTVAPINKMVEPYTPQQFFDQKADTLAYTKLPDFFIIYKISA